jgi:hypothetical protein
MWIHRVALVVITVLLSSTVALAQGFSWPEEPENMTVLPSSVKGSELGIVMRSFAGALGVRCRFCHAAREGQEINPMDLMTFDFASDANPMKDKARTMLQMVSAINEAHLSKLEVGASDRLWLRFFTCHPGLEKPPRLEEVLAAEIETDGIDAAIATYHELRQRHYGGAAFNFRPGVLGWLGEQLIASGELGPAIAILTLENEQHPDFAWGHYLRATAHDEVGERKAAREHMQRAVDVASPDQKEFMSRALEALK